MITLNNKTIEFDKFPNGDIYLKTNLNTIFDNFTYESFTYESASRNQVNVVEAVLYTSDNILELSILMNAMFYYKKEAKNILQLLYCPYMQADKYIKEQTCSVSLDIITRIINGCCFDKVYVYGAHSIKVKEKINNCVLLYPIFPIEDITKDENFYVCSPDAGSSNRTKAFANILKTENYIECEKVRDLTTGKLVSFKLCWLDSNEDLTDRDVIIYDDVSVNGGTFSGVAKLLKEKGAKNVYLCTTFVINMKPIEYIDRTFTTNLFPGNQNFKGVYGHYNIYHYKRIKYFQIYQ